MLYMVTRYVQKPTFLGGKSDKSIHIELIVIIKRINHNRSEEFNSSNFSKMLGFLSESQ